MKILIFFIFQNENILPGTPVLDINKKIIYGLTLPIMKKEPVLTVPFNFISDVYEDFSDYFESLKSFQPEMKKEKVHIQPFLLSTKQILNFKISICIVLCRY